MFLVALSSVALAVLLALGPLFLALLLFETTRRFFEAWVAQLANYALISILTVLVAALLLQIVESYAEQTAARGSAILTVDALDMVLMAVLVFLLMRQVMPIAAALAGGVALSTLRADEPLHRLGHAPGGRRRARDPRGCRARAAQPPRPPSPPSRWSAPTGVRREAPCRGSPAPGPATGVARHADPAHLPGTERLRRSPAAL